MTEQTQTLGPGYTPMADESWCIDPVAAKGSCTISLSNAGSATMNPLDVDTEGGWSSNPEICFQERVANPNGTGVQLDLADVQAFGGREAEHRVWTYTCSTTHVIRVEQYEVAYAPARILYSEGGDSTVSAAMSTIAKNSTLPPQTLPVRLADKGYVRSVTKVASGYAITLDRIYNDPYSDSGEINKAATTYSYTIPTALVTQAPVVGDRVWLATNGTTVTKYERVGG